MVCTLGGVASRTATGLTHPAPEELQFTDVLAALSDPVRLAIVARLADAGAGGELTSLRLDTGEACFLDQHRCAPYGSLAGTDKARADAVVARWGSERWRDRQRAR